MDRTLSSLTRAFALGAALAASAASPAVAHADPSAPSDRAADLYRRATQLYKDKQLAQAEPLYVEAWSLQQSYDIASNLGALELELGRPARAAELLSHAVREFPVRARPEERTALNLRLADAKSRVAVLHVRVSAPGAEVFVDGQSVGHTPLPAEIFVEPGTRVVVAKLFGHANASVPVRVTRGAAYDVDLAPKLPPAPNAPPPPPPSKRSVVPAIAGGIFGVLAAGTGATLVVLAGGQRRNATSLHDSIAATGGTCAIASARCTDLHAATARADTFANAGVVAFAAAGAAALGTATYLLWPALKVAPPRPMDMRASLGLGPGGGGVSLSGSF
ncbi:MAG: PEGA domain-containing protein [Byssovorax sp.]